MKNNIKVGDKLYKSYGYTIETLEILKIEGPVFKGNSDKRAFAEFYDYNYLQNFTKDKLKVLEEVKTYIENTQDELAVRYQLILDQIKKENASKEI